MLYRVHDFGIGELETEVDLYTFNLDKNEYLAVPIRSICRKNKLSCIF